MNSGDTCSKESRLACSPWSLWGQGYNYRIGISCLYYITSSGLLTYSIAAVMVLWFPLNDQRYISLSPSIRISTHSIKVIFVLLSLCSRFWKLLTARDSVMRWCCILAMTLMAKWRQPARRISFALNHQLCRTKTYIGDTESSIKNKLLRPKLVLINIFTFMHAPPNSSVYNCLHVKWQLCYPFKAVQRFQTFPVAVLVVCGLPLLPVEFTVEFNLSEPHLAFFGELGVSSWANIWTYL